MDIKFNFESLSFLSNVQTNKQYEKLGMAELYEAASMSGSDHSQFFDAFSKLVESLEAVTGAEIDLDDLLSLKSDNANGAFCPSAVYGGAVQVHPELGLCLSFGTNHFPVSQKGKDLFIAPLEKGLVELKIVGELKIKDNKREDGSVYYSMFWEVPITDDYDFIFAVPIAVDPSDPEGKKPLNLTKDIFKKDIVANNNLADYVRVQSQGGGLFENYGNCPRIENAPDPIKPAKLEDGVYVLTGIAHGVLKKKDTGEEFDSVIGYLEDGTRVSLNSYAKSDFIANPSSFRFPLQWVVTHLDATRTRSVLRNISAPTSAPKTALPSRFAGFASKTLKPAAMATVAPTKTAAPNAYVGGSSADFEKIVEVQTKQAVGDSNPDDDF